MKILQVNASYKPAYIYGGPTMSVAKLSEELVKAGHNVTVFTTTANGANTELPVIPNHKIMVEGVNVIYFTRITRDHTHFSPRLLSKLWKEAPDFDIIHIHAWWNLVSVLSVCVALLRKRPVVLSPRGTLSAYAFNHKNSQMKKWLQKLLGQHLLKRSYLHATAVAEQQELIVLTQTRGIFTIANFVKLPGSYLVMNPPNAIFRLLFFSRIDEKKGLEILLNALPLLTVPYHLTIAGDGDKNYIDQLKQIASDNLSSEHISWIGFQNETKFDVFSKHQILILPSQNENFGNVIIESLSVGTAVLISEDVGLADYVSKNNFGWVCPANYTSVSFAINNIAINCQDELLQIRSSAPAAIKNDFDEVNLMRKYINMYQQIIKDE